MVRVQAWLIACESVRSSSSLSFGPSSVQRWSWVSEVRKRAITGFELRLHVRVAVAVEEVPDAGRA